MARVLVTGDRNWDDAATIRTALAEYHASEVIVGDARGADTLAAFTAAFYNLPVSVYAADWQRYGKAAGPMRNRRMLTDGKPDIVLAFHDNLRESKGTRDCMTQARARGIRVLLFSSTEGCIYDSFATKAPRPARIP